ncbi:MAG: dTDP-4-dehydrorhamnose 3,5-epimerase and related enzyme, dTDP-4-dehydrorhamnose 3,5-epimerase [Microgenomates group bacterium GW2011_GWC1_37_8]|nr:MAG: dTDP-4-dehydrorhamnose 3,5-epimerase and related enzyme, dTDP-4-dehydrorhamnose 3,5-epimerase [Microgenomates group bacterium GW2011_GWC1_37_8]
MKKEIAKKVLTKDSSGRENGFLLEILKSLDGKKTEVYLISATPKSSKGFHLHRRRASRYVCVRGSVRVTGYEFRNGAWEREVITLDSIGDSLYIPTNVATLIENIGEEDVWLINCPIPAYDSQDKDEQVEYSLDELKKGVRK